MIENQKKEMLEINKNEINEKAEIDKKLNVFYNQINFINNSLDIIRNRIFNLIITRMYIKDINFNYQIILDNITNSINEIDKNYIELVNSLNLSFGDKNEKINNYIKQNSFKNQNKKNNKKDKKLSEKDFTCSELKTIVETTEENLTD